MQRVTYSDPSQGFNCRNDNTDGIKILSTGHFFLSFIVSIIKKILPNMICKHLILIVCLLFNVEFGSKKLKVIFNNVQKKIPWILHLMFKTRGITWQLSQLYDLYFNVNYTNQFVLKISFFIILILKFLKIINIIFKILLGYHFIS